LYRRRIDWNGSTHRPWPALRCASWASQLRGARGSTLAVPRGRRRSRPRSSARCLRARRQSMRRSRSVWGRGLRQIASVVLPNVGLLILASIIEPGAWLAIGPGSGRDRVPRADVLVLPDLTHNSMFSSRKANSRWGYLLGLSALHALSLVAAPTQPASRQYRQPRQARSRRDLHDDAHRVRARVPRPAVRVPGLPQPVLMLFVSRASSSCSSAGSPSATCPGGSSSAWW
jgi:hypothetical protein